jgi:hypothetical protein
MPKADHSHCGQNLKSSNRVGARYPDSESHTLTPPCIAGLFGYWTKAQWNQERYSSQAAAAESAES